MGNALSQMYPQQAPKLTEKNLPSQAGKARKLTTCVLMDIANQCIAMPDASNSLWSSS